ncbi:hypothetical protein L6452_40367 [Arctium lappa]|uniref:Uncharacterized protein n=1 Tax=Arctium lappa TaxID=4217 RepID=A0ACB8XL78_ARCLA|nr:hypothetical protein L6452_40367 [Arctium lappa]
MFSSNEPPSFSSAGIHSGDHDGSAQTIQSTGDMFGQLPSYGALGHGQGNELLPDTIAYRGIGQGTVDGDKPPSFTALGHGQGNSHNHDGTFDRGVAHAYGYSDGGQAPSVGNVCHVCDSQTSGGRGGDPFSDGKAPSISDFGRRENSRNRVSSIDDQAASLEAWVGMSLVGKNFKMFYPMAYYKEKDEK